MRTAFLILVLACASCLTYRPATSALQVMPDAPPGAVRVGTVLPLWIEETSHGCTNPPASIVVQAEKWGADVIVADVKHDTYGNGRTLCIAHAFAIGDAS